MEESNQHIFYEELLKNSINKDRKLAIEEWEFKYSFEEDNHCICGMPIKENCIIINKNNNKSLLVGNVCVNRFINKDCSFIFRGMKSINKDKVPNKLFIDYCFEKGYIYENQKDFLLKMFRKRKLTDRQNSFKMKILFKLKLRKRY